MDHLEKISGDNIWDIMKPEAADEQKVFVGGNDNSRIGAYMTISSDG